MQALFLLAVASAFCPAALPDQPTITGVVQGDKGQALTGAHVFISTAAPRQGVGVL